MFIPRLKKPESGNKYYNTPAKGGYAVGAILGKPTDSGCNVLANCVGYAAGRFNEILGADKWLYLLYPPNAEYFISMAAKQGLKTGTEPKLGAIICWEGIGSAAGHVAIVEQINADGSIVTSESGYNCKNPFWTTHRYKELGNWGQNATKYKFQGFIYQPEGGKDLNGIDISYCQKKVDWTKVNADFVIIRAGYGRYTHQKDTMFEDHYAGAKQRGIPVGAYWYSYAKSEEDARKEADACVEILKGKQFEYPIYYDVEEKDTLNLGKEKVSVIIRAFLERVEAAGYWVGLYMSRSPLENLVTDDVRKRYAIWLAEWDVVKPTYKGAYGVWQNGTGTVSGLPDKVDTDVCYVDYPTQIKAKGLNGYGGEPEPPLPESKYFEISFDGKTYAGNLALK